jgi:LPS export ABC transporter permease LptF/LPS export ABC transporter permease LptG
MFKFFDRYILREIGPPFGIGLLIFTFVLLMSQILVLAELFITKGVSFRLAAEVLIDLIPSLLAFAVPMAVLMGILAGLSRLSTDSEIVAFKTLGISSKRLAWPIFVFAFTGWLVTSYLTMFLAPHANFKWVQTMTSSVLAKVQVKFNPREFNESIPKMVIYIQDISREKKWENIFVYMTKDPAEPRLILAREGKLDLYPEEKKATLVLQDGTVHSYPLKNPDKYSFTSFKRLEEGIDVEALFASISSEKRVREKDILELFSGVKVIEKDLAELKTGKAAAAKNALPRGAAPGRAATPQALREKTRDFRSHWVEIHKKFALPFVCFIFVLVGLPLGVTTRKGGRTSGFTISIAIILLYYILITAGEKLAMDGKISPFLGMWGPNILLLLAGAYLFLKSLREAAFFSGLAGFLRKWKKSPEEVRMGRALRKMPRIHLRFPNILDRYVIRKYLAIFAIIFAGLVSVSIIVTFFERIDNVYAHDKPLSLFLQYIWFRVPEFVSYILPVTALTTALLALGILTKFNEVTAMKACGISVYRLIFPILFMALVVSLFSFYLQERILPRANNKAEEVWNRINDRPPRSYSYVNRHWVLGREKNRIYHYDFFDPGPSVFSRLSIFDIDLASWALSGRTYAEKAYLKEDRLRLVEGWKRTFSGTLPASFEVQPERELAGVETKSYFLKEWKEPVQMTYSELRKYTAEVEEMGFEASRFKVDLNTKISFPFVCLIMTLLGVPFAFSMGTRGTLVGIGLSIVIAMVFWGAIGVFRSLGYVNFLGPFLAAWTPNLIFGLIGVYLLFRLRT